MACLQGKSRTQPGRGKTAGGQTVAVAKAGLPWVATHPCTALLGLVWDASFIQRLVCKTTQNVHSKGRVLDEEQIPNSIFQ